MYLICCLLLCAGRQIVISWFLSPVAAGLVACIVFLLVRTLVLRRANSTSVAFYVLPVLIILTIWVNLFFILVSELDAWSAVACVVLMAVLLAACA